MVTAVVITKCKWNGFSVIHYLKDSRHLSLGCDSFSDILCFAWSWRVVLKGNGQVFCRLPLNLHLSGVFIVIRLGEAPFSSHHISGRMTSRWLTTDTYLLLKCSSFGLELHEVDYCVPLTCPHCFGFFVHLFSGITRCFRFILYFSCSHPMMSQSSKGPHFLLLENGI